MSANREIKNFFKYGFGHFGELEDFKKGWLYSYFESIFGEMVFLPFSTLKFITLDSNGYFFDEIYSKQGQIPSQIGTLIPKKLVGLEKNESEAWHSLSKNGYYIYEDIEIPDVYLNELNKETYKQDSTLPNSILFPSYNDNYVPDYVQGIADFYNKKFNLTNKNFKIDTDSIKYIYNPSSDDSFGPYKYHMDYLKNMYYMYFIYKIDSDVEGRELVIGERDLSFLGDDLDIKSICKNNSKVKDKHVIKIKDNMCVLLNTYNPKFVHRVNKMSSNSEVVLLTNYAKVP